MMKSMKVCVLVASVCAILSAAAGTVYYFDPVKGNDDNKGLTPETAFKTLSKKNAWAHQGDGDEYRLLPGVYKESFHLQVSDGRIIGWGKTPADVVIDGEGVRRGIQVNGKRAMVANLTVRDAYHEASAANAVNCGAGIQLYEVGAVASNCVVYGCRNAKHCGGGIYLAAASNVVEYCFVSNCLSASGAPGIYAANQCVGQVIHDTTVVCCTNMVASDSAGSGCGGGISLMNSCADVYNVTVRQCRVQASNGGGGGIYRQTFRTSGAYFAGPEVGILSNCVVSGCSAVSGGGIFLYNLTNGLIVTDCIISNNCATGTGSGGGGVRVALSSSLAHKEGKYVFTRCTVVDNESAGGGGGYYGQLGGDMMSRCVFRNNRAKVNGGGVMAYGDRPPMVVDACVFEGNQVLDAADWHFGGGFCDAMSVNANSFYRNCLFVGNTVANGSGGGLGCNDRNSAGYPMAMENCTFAGNSVGTQGGAKGGAAVGARAARAVSATNCVFHGNVFTSAVTAYVQISDTIAVADGKFSHCFETDATGKRLTDGVNGCIVKAGSPFTSDDHSAYAMQKEFGRNAGIVKGWMASTTDLGGKPRLAKDEDGNVTVDFGCYQFWRKPGLLLFVQ